MTTIDGWIEESIHDTRVQVSLEDIACVLAVYRPEHTQDIIAGIVYDLVRDVHNDVRGYYVDRTYRQANQASWDMLGGILEGLRLAGETRGTE